MPKNAPIIAIPADPGDSDDFDITEADLQVALQERARRPRSPNKAPIKAQVTLRLDPL